MGNRAKTFVPGAPVGAAAKPSAPAGPKKQDVEAIKVSRRWKRSMSTRWKQSVHAAKPATPAGSKTQDVEFIKVSARWKQSNLMIACPNVPEKVFAKIAYLKIAYLTFFAKIRAY